MSVSDSARARVREYKNPPPCVSACASKFVCPTFCDRESECLCVRVDVLSHAVTERERERERERVSECAFALV